MSNPSKSTGAPPRANIPDAHFGSPHNPPLNWRKRPDREPDDDADRPAPESVRRLLGFDPHAEDGEEK